MTIEKILEVVLRYRTLLEGSGVPKTRMQLDRTLGSLTRDELLAHAHYLLDGVEKYAQTPGKEGKTGRHLASVQCILSFAGLITLADMMEHNRPDSGRDTRGPNGS